MPLFSLSDFESLVYHPYPYEQKLVSVIDQKGRQILVESFGALSNYADCTVKIEGLERYSYDIDQFCQQLKLKFSHSGPITCHAFRAGKNSSSFGLHKDLENVYLLVVDGTKHMMYNNKMYELNQGDDLFIPAGTPHQAVNNCDSLMLSFGLESYIGNRLL